MDPGNSGGGVNGSSDFVRKLYRMLEDPSHNNIVRWSATGDSFVVVDTNLFTTKILPQHFKHCNFASFVRQLNKYDFHKIKNTEEGSGQQLGEFKHPEFTRDSKDNLDNIRRKAPQPRKTQQQIEEAGAQQIEAISRECASLRETSEDNSQRLGKLVDQCNVTVDHMHQMQVALTAHADYVRQHEDVIRKILAVLSAVSSEVQELRQERRNYEQNNQGHHDGGLSPADTTGMGSAASVNSPEALNNHPSGSLSPLQQVKQLAQNYDNIPKPNLQSNESNGNFDQQPQESYGSYNNGMMQNGNGMGNMNGSQQNPNSFGGPSLQAAMMYNQNNSFAMPQHCNGGSSGVGTPPNQMPGRKRSMPNTPKWRASPSVLLVEDDPTCRRIGVKFLQGAHCTVDVADDGLIAVNKMRRRKYDLVLMDIMMPNLDGCTAAHLIRQFERRTPIIAMTSNIRADDINAYFNNGMTDVLPKPFTRDGLLALLEKMLEHLKEPGAHMNNSHHIPAQIPPSIDITRVHPQNHEISDVPKTSPSSLQYSTSPVPIKSPVPQVMYGHGNPSDLNEQNLAQNTPVSMDDGYMNMMGYSEGNSSQAGPYESPSSMNKRRRDDMIGPMPGEDIYGNMDVKKPRGVY